MLNDIVKDLLAELGKISRSEAVAGNVRDAGKAKVMPLCKISIGFGTGGADFGGRDDGGARKAGFDGGAAAGALSVEPRAFVVVGPDGIPQMFALKRGKAAVLRRGVEIAQVPAAADAPAQLDHGNKNGR
jgi:uncharacterized spore protein YtfJ